MATLDAFLSSLGQFIRNKDAKSLQDWLIVEPPLSVPYLNLIAEVRASFPEIKGTDGKPKENKPLEAHTEKLIPINDDAGPDEGPVWPGLQAFIQKYLEFMRDVNYEDLLTTHVQLSALMSACIAAFSHNNGIFLLPTCVHLSSAIAKLAVTLDKQPDLVRKLQSAQNASGEGERKSIVETTAELIQRPFAICLTAKGSSQSGILHGKPEGKKVGVLTFANLVFKLLFRARKTTLASNIIENISQQAPPLKIYPAAERVTYLYYLGRFMFVNKNWYLAALSFNEAYIQCHPAFLAQRKQILTYAITTNIICGRFPSAALLSRPEAEDLKPRFEPIVEAIRKGDLPLLKRALGPEYGNEDWFWDKGLFLPLLYRCEVLVWRSLTRRVFQLTYAFPADGNDRVAPTLRISDVLVAAEYCQKLLEGWSLPSDPLSLSQEGRTHTNAIFMRTPSLVPPPDGPRKLMPSEGVIHGNMAPDMLQMEALVASLVQQGFLHGFVSHSMQKFAVLGSKVKGGPMAAGWPVPWQVIRTNAGSDEVPGWVKNERKQGGGVVNLSGARPAGS